MKTIKEEQENINNTKDIENIININNNYYRNKNKLSYFSTYNPNKNINYVYCNRNIPSYTPINFDDNYLRKYYIKKRTNFFNNNKFNKINDDFIDDIMYLLSIKKLKVKNKNLLKDDLLHFIYIYSHK